MHQAFDLFFNSLFKQSIMARGHFILREDAGILILLCFCCINGIGTFANVSESENRDPHGDTLNVTLYDVTVNVCDRHQTCEVVGCGISNNTVCNCDDACIRYGDCCWDFNTTCKPDKDAYETPADRNTYTSVTTCETTPFYSRSRSVESHFMIGRCPKEWEFAEIRDLCERTSRNDSIIHWLRVDSGEGVSFKNIYCAFCNGVEPSDIISWEIFAMCSGNVTLSSSWSDMLQCSILNMKPLNPLTLTKLTPCSCCLPKEGIFPSLSSCSYLQASVPTSKACAMYEAPITVRKSTYNNPHCFLCDVTFNNSNRAHPNQSELQDVCFFEDMDKSAAFASPPYGVVPVSIFFDLPTLDELFNNVRKWAPKPSLKNCENKMQTKVHDFKADCEFQATIDDLCYNGTSHGFILNTEIIWEGEIVGIGSESVIASSIVTYMADLFQVSPAKLQIIDNHFPSCLSRNENIRNDLVATECQTGLNFTIWLDYNEYGRYHDELISIHSIFLSPQESNYVKIQHLDVVRGCLGDDSSPIDLCLGNLDEVKNTTNLDLPNNSYICVDEECSDIVLVRNLKGIFHMENTSNRDTTLSYARQACVTRWCELHTIDVNTTFDDYTFVNSVIESIEKPFQSSITVSRWNQTHVLVCSSEKHKEGVFQVQHQIVTLVGCVISIVSLVLTLITYTRFPLLRRSTFVKLVMGLAAALLLGQLQLILFLGIAAYNVISCTVLSIMAHYIWLSVFTFMLFIAIELHRTFGRRNSKLVRDEKPRVFLSYLFCAFTFPLFIIIPCLVLHSIKWTSLTYGDAARGCWIGDAMANLLAFVLPITCIIILNAVVFVATVYHLCTTQGDVFKNDTRKRRTESRRNLRISMKISTLMGFTWFFGFAATYLHYQALWYVFILLNTLQGLFIFISFMCNGNIWRLWTSQR